MHWSFDGSQHKTKKDGDIHVQSVMNKGMISDSILQTNRLISFQVTKMSLKCHFNVILGRYTKPIDKLLKEILWK